MLVPTTGNKHVFTRQTTIAGRTSTQFVLMNLLANEIKSASDIPTNNSRCLCDAQRPLYTSRIDELS